MGFSAMRAVLWGLVGVALAFLALRLLRLSVWMLLRPGGWAVIAAATLVAVAASR